MAGKYGMETLWMKNSFLTLSLQLHILPPGVFSLEWGSGANHLPSWGALKSCQSVDLLWHAELVYCCSCLCDLSHLLGSLGDLSQSESWLRSLFQGSEIPFPHKLGFSSDWEAPERKCVMDQFSVLEKDSLKWIPAQLFTSWCPWQVIFLNLNFFLWNNNAHVIG